jgi:hypothetical protein
MKPALEQLARLFENEVKDILEHTIQAQQPKGGKTAAAATKTADPAPNLLPALSKMETRLLAGLKEASGKSEETIREDLRTAVQARNARKSLQ